VLVVVIVLFSLLEKKKMKFEGALGKNAKQLRGNIYQIVEG
jgi:hypothetical protein